MAASLRAHRSAARHVETFEIGAVVTDRTWTIPPEPDETVQAVESRHGTIWTRAKGGWVTWGWDPPQTATWGTLLCMGAPLEEYHMPPGGPDA